MLIESRRDVSLPQIKQKQIQKRTVNGVGYSQHHVALLFSHLIQLAMRRWRRHGAIKQSPGPRVTGYISFTRLFVAGVVVTVVFATYFYLSFLSLFFIFFFFIFFKFRKRVDGGFLDFHSLTVGDSLS